MNFVLRCMISLVSLFSLLLNPCYCLNSKVFNVSQFEKDNNEWQMATATWYGPPTGAGSDGGACGYGDSVEKQPLNKMTSATGPSLYRNGKGCGACYEVKCTENIACSGNLVTVMISDECPGCFQSAVHFDLSGTAFGSIAKPGHDNNLRNVGNINIQSKRVACAFGNSIAFTIDNGANPYYFAIEIEYENGDGDIVQVELKQGNEQNVWLPMQRSWGARWVLSNNGLLLKPPFSIKITESGNGSAKTIEADKVIPQNWKPGQVYRSPFNFPPKIF